MLAGISSISSIEVDFFSLYLVINAHYCFGSLSYDSADLNPNLLYIFLLILRAHNGKSGAADV